MRILIIEDDEPIVGFVKRGLEAEGFGVDVARDGHEGLEMARADYHLIILDLLLPVKNGTEVCQTLRSEQFHTPILMLTAKDTLKDKVQGLQAGADDYLTKPFAFEELLARSKALLRRGPYKEIPAILKVEDLTLDREIREVQRGGEILSLTAKEYGLLEYMMSHPNKPLSRSLILDQVWGQSYDPLTNVVDVYIGYLRKKVDAGFKKRLIETVRDFGYKIVSD